MSIKVLKDYLYQCRHRLDLFLSRIWYKNLAGANLNRIGLKRWAENRKLYGGAKQGNFPLGYHLFTLQDKKLIRSIQKKYQDIIDKKEYTIFF